MHSRLDRSTLALACLVAGLLLGSATRADLTAGCGDPAAGDCYQPNGTTHCDDAVCCQLVCAVDPFCCYAWWDDGCVSMAHCLCYTGPVGCGQPGTGNCFVVNGSPYCNNKPCCETVCAVDPWCCTCTWDSTCAFLATQQCQPTFVSDWIFIPHTARRYRLVSESSWLIANWLGNSHGGKLAKVRDPLENEWLRRALVGAAGLDAAWIGFAEGDVPGFWGWTWGGFWNWNDPSGYVSWAPDHPARIGGLAKYAELGIDGLWRAQPLTEHRHGIFESMTLVCQSSLAFGACDQPHGGYACNRLECCNQVCYLLPSCCSTGWDQACVDLAERACDPVPIGDLVPYELGGRRFQVVGPGSWLSAERVANAMGGHLVRIRSWEEYEWLWSNFAFTEGCDGRFFIGVHDQGFPGQYRWTNSDAATFLHWAPGQPSAADPAHRFVQMRAPDGTFHHAAMVDDERWGGCAIIELPCFGDLDGDGWVSGADLGLLLAAWGSEGAPWLEGDLNGDGVVNGADLGILLSGWGPCARSSCCTVGHAAGCDQPGCAECVCDFIPSCCDTAWDLSCVFYAAIGCWGTCGCAR